MTRIKQLSTEIIAKIAAGEVIERPAFAVKELLENAIDAHASSIEIFIEQAGMQTIQVSDDGMGMSKEDLLLSWQPHTTSKLTDEKLLGITTLGFRGEALASLAAISDLTIISRDASKPIGHRIEIHHGAIITSVPQGAKIGTTVIAKNLFSLLPARKKFLKSSAVELRHIMDVIIAYALSHPEIGFTYMHNKKKILHFSPTQDKGVRTAEIIGNTFSLFLPLQNQSSYYHLSGFLAKPQLHSRTTNKQYLFVNKRKVSDKLISLAVKEAFGTMLESTQYPQFVLFLDIPYEQVDVNVHPRKEYVSFPNGQDIFQFVKDSVSELLEKNNLTFSNLSWQRNGVGTTRSFAGTLLRETVLEKALLKQSLHAFAQLNKLYIVAPSTKGLFLIDQHAAHERILFEKLKKAFLSERKKRKLFPLGKPFIIDTNKQYPLLLEQKHALEKLGFVLEKKNSQVVLTHVPLLLHDRPADQLLTFFEEELEEGKPLTALDIISHEMLAFLACRSAVKAGDNLDKKQMKEILTQLETVSENATCPHGRPTRIFLEIDYLHKLFKRS